MANRWEKYKKSIEEVPVTERGIEKYLEYFSLTEAELKNRTILDIAAGTRKFAREVEERGIPARVFSMDPLYGLSTQEVKEAQEAARKEIERTKFFGISGFNRNAGDTLEENSSDPTKKHSVAAFAEELPFKDEVFDLTLCSYGLPMYSKDVESVKRFFQEIDRVTKWGGGEIRIYPLKSRDPEVEAMAIREAKEIESKKGYKVTWVPIESESVLQHVSRLDKRERVSPYLLIITKGKKPKNVREILGSIIGHVMSKLANDKRGDREAEK